MRRTTAGDSGTCLGKLRWNDTQSRASPPEMVSPTSSVPSAVNATQLPRICPPTWISRTPGSGSTCSFQSSITGSVRGNHSFTGVDVHRHIAELPTPAQLRAEHVRMAGRDHRDAAHPAHQAHDVVIEVARRIPKQVSVNGLHDKCPVP